MIDGLFTFIMLSPLLLGLGLYFISKKHSYILNTGVIFITSIEMIGVLILTILSMNKGIEIHIDKLFIGISFKFDNFRCIYALISSFMWLMTSIFSREYMKNHENQDRYYLFYLLTLLGVNGIFFSADFITLFVFFEIMSLSSYLLVVHEENKRAYKAGELYLSISIIAGMILLMGLFMLYSKVNSLNIDEIKSYIDENGINNEMLIIGVLLLIGFGAKAGMFPLHIWLPKAHPIAPAPASALLSGVLTKTGIFGIILISANMFLNNYTFAFIVLLIAILTMIMGAILAIISIDLKQTLACSTISQIGFILLAMSFMMLLNDKGGIAADGAMLHMINHSFVKLVLFMSAGVIAMNVDGLDLNKIKGFGRKKPFLMIIFGIGALSIMGVPFFGGYISKTLIHESILEYIKAENLVGQKYILMRIVEWLFVISSGLTITYMSKLFIVIFIEKNNSEEKQLEYDNNTNYLSTLSKIVLGVSSVVLIVIGIIPNVIVNKVLNPSLEIFRVEKFEGMKFYNLVSFRGFLISLVTGIFTYFIIVRMQLIKDKEYIKQIEQESSLGTELWHLILIPVFFVFKCIALAMDGLFVLLKKTILKPHSYKFNDVSFAYKIGVIIDKFNPKKYDKRYYAKKADKAQGKFMELFNLLTSDFSFAMAMICIGLVIIIAFALLV